MSLRGQNIRRRKNDFSKSKKAKQVEMRPVFFFLSFVLLSLIFKVIDLSIFDEANSRRFRPKVVTCFTTTGFLRNKKKQWTGLIKTKTANCFAEISNLELMKLQTIGSHRVKLRGTTRQLTYCFVWMYEVPKNITRTDYWYIFYEVTWMIALKCIFWDTSNLNRLQ